MQRLFDHEGTEEHEEGIKIETFVNFAFFVVDPRPDNSRTSSTTMAN